ncbi:nucleotidyltransferase domain-containing protein [Nocardia arthritidis]|uniref:Nucleotidyltransferase domain-containing protein n=1 Tax=Nocardia arthritidis TaxID=228602 RepID=A0A6G9YTT9_9NOCA|nr:nucleotidyltransferase domain-containing protein [Nocardia arthritidis]QIS16622.1 nucleotidyltransferase domain-containing protein [Nocardia arthritidis]
MFSEQRRDQLRDELVAAARADQRITAAALTGSGAIDRTDRWSDIDLALRLADDVAEQEVVADWTDRMYRAHEALDHVDIYLRRTRFRVFLCADTLQVDIAFWSATEFGAIGPNFRLLFGSANTRPQAAAPDTSTAIGVGWLYALHARSAIARGRVWQAQYLIDGLREQALNLACLRHGLVAVQGRGYDDLPAEVHALFADTLVSGVGVEHLRSALRATIEALLHETDAVDRERAQRLRPTLRELTVG